jgi:tripartite-type tricarboxylate transporter receptor subunit TctC
VVIDNQLCDHQKKVLFAYPVLGYGAPQLVARSRRQPMRAHCNGLRFGLCLFAALTPIAASAQTPAMPAGPVKFITPMAAGVGTDPVMRIVVDRLGKMWERQTELINQPGGGGAIAVRAAADAAPDGRTLLLAIASTFTVLPTTRPDLVATLNSLVPIGFVGEVPMGIAVSPRLPATTLTDLVAVSKKQSAGLDVAVEFRGSMPDLATQLLRDRTGANLNSVYYVAGGPAMSDVASGRVPIMVQGLSSPIAGGQLKLIAISSSARLPTYPDVPTASETVPGFAASGWFVLVAPPGTPGAIADKMNNDLRTVLAQPDVSEKFDALNVLARSLSRQQLGTFIRDEQQLWSPVAKQLGLATQ